MFQTIMPGRDGMLEFRGLRLAAFAHAFGPGRDIAGVVSGCAGVAVTVLFAAGHGPIVSDGIVTMNWHAVFVTGVIGAGLPWLRTRTGSLAMPPVAHNLVTFGNTFF